MSKNVISLECFKKEVLSIKSCVFSSSNQNWSALTDPMKISICFDKINVEPRHPAIIWLTSEVMLNTEIRITRIREIIKKEYGNNVEYIIRCNVKNERYRGNNIEYRLICC